VSILIDHQIIDRKTERLEIEVNELKQKSAEMEAKLQQVIDLMGTQVINK
jgi:hypothetical protein